MGSLMDVARLIYDLAKAAEQHEAEATRWCLTVSLHDMSVWTVNDRPATAWITLERSARERISMQVSYSGRHLTSTWEVPEVEHDTFQSLLRMALYPLLNEILGAFAPWPQWRASWK